uniref:Uncharacterized protein n=1 Tax=Phytophthora ramorum TaxID=164328 RepID=H3GHV7_PHYRM
MGLPEHTTPPAMTRRRASSCMSPIHEFHPMDMPRAFKGERSVSCPEPRTTGVERFVLTSAGVSFESEAFLKIAHLLATATSPVSSSANALLARKALKYRKLDVLNGA